MRGNAIRKPVLIIGASGIVLVIALLCWFFLTEGGPGRFETPGMRTNILLMSVADRTITDPLVILSVGAGSDDLCLFIPPELRIKRPDGTFARLGDTYAEGGVAGVREALADFLGIELAYHLAVEDPPFKELIDSIGGLTVRVESEVVYLDRTSDPPTEVRIRPGEQTLDGDTTLAYLRGESAAGRAARAEQLLRAILSQGFIDRGEREVARTVRSLGKELETDLSLADLYALADSIRKLDPDNLPTPTIPGELVTIDGKAYLRPKAVETERIVASALKGLQLLTPSDVNVAVFNGNGLKLMATKTADYLRARGFQITRIGNADTFSYDTSYIVVLTDEAKGWTLRDALPSPVKIVFPDGFSEHYEALKGLIPIGTDLILIVGLGWRIEG